MAEVCFVVRSVNYDGNVRGRTWQEHICKTAVAAERQYAQLSKPKQYGDGLAYYTTNHIEDLSDKPRGLIKWSLCGRAMIVVEMCEVLLEE